MRFPKAIAKSREFSRIFAFGLIIFSGFSHVIVVKFKWILYGASLLSSYYNAIAKYYLYTLPLKYPGRCQKLNFTLHSLLYVIIINKKTFQYSFA